MSGSNGQYQEETTALVPLPAVQPPQLSQEFFEEPIKVLERAEKVAKALKEFLDRKPKKVEFNGKRYPEAEDWQFVGAFFRHTARVRSTTELRDEDNFVVGYVAFAEVVNPAGLIVSAAEAACMRTEPNWGGKKPDFQLRSMAQTRACAKALKNVFAWVMVLAGLSPTPAEEMTGDETPEVARPRRRSGKAKPEVEVIDTSSTLSFIQQKELFDYGKQHGLKPKDVMQAIAKLGFQQPGEIPQAALERIRKELAGVE